MSFKSLEGQTGRWIQRLQKYNFTSQRCQGWKHNSADVLSRKQSQKECTRHQNVEMRAFIN
jgi:hypothetical protein